MTTRLFYWALTSALAGFLFGFDTVVISGAEQTIQSLWNLDSATHGLAIGSALWGMVLGSLVGGWPADRFGRKATLMAVGVLFFVSSVWSALRTGRVPTESARSGTSLRSACVQQCSSCTPRSSKSHRRPSK